MDIKIEIATIENLKDIQNLNLMLFKKEQKEYDSTFNLNWTFGEEGIKYFLDSINSENACVFIAKTDNKIVGYLVGWIREVSSFRTIGTQTELDNMFVLREFRNKKIGKKLVENFLEWSRKKNIKNVAVSVFACNKKAIDFYRKCGFDDYVNRLEINF